MKIRLDGSVFKIDDNIYKELKGASNDVLLKIYFENGGIMTETDGFVNIEPENYQTQKSFLSFFILVNLRGERGQKILSEVFEKFKNGEIDQKGRIAFAN